jgi:hypothetical protein
MPIVSEHQRKAMYSALHGESTLGIPKSVAEEYVSKDEMPETAEELLRLCGAEEATYDDEQDKAFGDWMADHYQNGLAEDSILLAMDRAPSDIALKGRDGLAFDFKTSRTYTPEGHLHVEQSNISKANVSPYRGSEIPNFQGLGLDPEKVYQLLRDPKELEKGASTFNNKPILSRHVAVDADDHDPDLVDGSVSNVKYEHPFLKGDLGIWRRSAIDDIENKKKQQLSSAYRYRADMTPGVYEGAPYDGVMRGLTFNHLARVAEGRAGDDVVVGDEQLAKDGPMNEYVAVEYKNQSGRQVIKRFTSYDAYQDWKRTVGDQVQIVNVVRKAANDKDLAQDSKEKLMTKPVLSRTAVAVQGALAVYLAPKWSKDAKVKLAMDAKPIDLGSLLTTVSAKSFKKDIPKIAAAVTKAVKPFLAQDADLEDLGKALDALKPEDIKEGNDLDPSSGLPMVKKDDDDMLEDDVSSDADPMAMVMQFLKGKIVDEDLAKVAEMCKAGAADGEDPDKKKPKPFAKDGEEEDGKPKAKDKDMAKDKDDEKVSKKEMEGAMDAALKKNSREVEARTVKRIQGISDAKAKVAPLVGELTMAFDSADGVFEHALKACGIEEDALKDVTSASYPLLIDQQIALKAATSKGRVRVGEGSMAMDSKSGAGFSKRYPNASKIEVGAT